jgi:hypothetical protein
VRVQRFLFISFIVLVLCDRDFYLLHIRNSAYSVKNQPTFRMNISPAFSGLKNKPSMKQAELLITIAIRTSNPILCDNFELSPTPTLTTESSNLQIECPATQNLCGSGCHISICVVRCVYCQAHSCRTEGLQVAMLTVRQKALSRIYTNSTKPKKTKTKLTRLDVRIKVWQVNFSERNLIHGSCNNLIFTDIICHWNLDLTR